MAQKTQYKPVRKPGKLTLPEAEAKFHGRAHTQRDLMELTGMTDDELLVEGMRVTGHTEAAIEGLLQMYS